MADNELVFKNAHELAALIRSRQVSPVEVVQAFLDRIDALNPKVNAFITVTRDQALQAARQAETEIRAGKYRGPLHGIPYAPKDILATRGIRTTNGSKVTADWVPDYESTITSRLDRAGAILIGKLNLLEFAMGSGVLSGFGPVRNPWDLAYSPSGSSSGSGAALAAYMVPLSVGTDTGGSIRGPAAFCGIVGLKQTYGRVSRYGVTTLSWSLDHAGPMTKSVTDAAEMLRVMAGPDPLDPTARPEPVPDYTKALTGEVRGLKIGIPTNYFFDDAQPEVDKAVRAAIRRLGDMGAELVEVEVPHADLAASAGWIIAMGDGACFHEKRLREQAALFDPLVRERLEAASFYTATDYIKAMRVRTILMRDMEEVFKKCDVMAVPGSGSVASKLPSPEMAKTDVHPGGVPYRGGNTFIGNMTGLPAMVIPCGFTSGPPVLPITIMFYGRPFDESTIFRVGHAYESVTDWAKRRPPVTYGPGDRAPGADRPGHWI
ncbi:MAG TPA: amidase [Vicinamibacterales bacterium]|nr:amidase [Vicinamibacterales bacterium]